MKNFTLLPEQHNFIADIAMKEYPHPETFDKRWLMLLELSLCLGFQGFCDKLFLIGIPHHENCRCGYIKFEEAKA